MGGSLGGDWKEAWEEIWEEDLEAWVVDFCVLQSPSGLASFFPHGGVVPAGGPEVSDPLPPLKQNLQGTMGDHAGAFGRQGSETWRQESKV